MKKNIVILIFAIAIIATFVFTRIYAGDYKSYQKYALRNAIKAHRGDLSDSEIEKYMSLPNQPPLEETKKGMVIEGEWVFFDPEIPLCVYFDGCKGEIIFE